MISIFIYIINIYIKYMLETFSFSLSASMWYALCNMCHWTCSQHLSMNMLHFFIEKMTRTATNPHVRVSLTTIMFGHCIESCSLPFVCILPLHFFCLFAWLAHIHVELETTTTTKKLIWHTRIFKYFFHCITKNNYKILKCIYVWSIININIWTIIICWRRYDLTMNINCHHSMIGTPPWLYQLSFFNW